MTDPHSYRAAVTPLLVVPDTDAALRCYAEAFDAEELFRLSMPDGAIAHAQMLIAGALVMLADENPDHGNLAPSSVGGSPVLMQLTVPDGCDGRFRRFMMDSENSRRVKKDSETWH